MHSRAESHVRGAVKNLPAARKNSAGCAPVRGQTVRFAAIAGWDQTESRDGAKFFKSYLEGLAALCRDQEYALKVIGKYARINDRDILPESYRTRVPQIPTRPCVRREDRQRIMDPVQEHRGARR